MSAWERANSNPKDGHHGRFAGRFILPGGLADLCFVTFHI